MMAIIVAHFSDVCSIRDPTHSPESLAVPAGGGGHCLSFSTLILEQVTVPPEMPIKDLRYPSNLQRLQFSLKPNLRRPCLP